MPDQQGDSQATRAKTAAPRRRRLRTAIIISGVALALLLVFVLAAPTLLGPMVRGRAEQAINDSIAGRADIGRLKLSWFGSQQLTAVSINDPSGANVATINLELRRGLWNLAMGGIGLGALDLGEAHLSGSATIVRYADGSTNAQQALAPRKPSGPKPTPPSSPAEPVSLPPTLSGSFIIDGLDLRVIDQAKQAAGAPAAVTRIPALTGKASITGASRAAMDLSGDFFYGPGPDTATTAGGRLTIAATVDSLTDAAGRLTLDKATIDAKADAGNIAVVIADTLAGMDSRLVQGIGDRLQASVRAKGTLAGGDATITASSPGFTLDLAVQSKDGVLSAPRNGTISVKGTSLRPLIPGLEQALAKDDQAQIDTLPDVNIVLSGLSIRLPSGGAPLDLRGSSLVLAVQTTEISGRVRVPAPGGVGEGTLQPFSIAPAAIRLESTDLTQRVTLKGGTAATLAGKSAGTLAIDLAALEPVGQTGAVAPGLPGRISGAASLSGVATAIAQPFAQASGIDLATDVGPTLDLSLRAEPATAAATSKVALDIVSANINAAARLLVSGSAARTEPEGITLNVGSVGPLATRMLASAGASVDTGGSVTLTATDIVIDLDKLRAKPANAAPSAPPPGPDLRAIAGVIRIETGPAAGRLSLPGEPSRAWGLSPFQATINAADLAQRLSLRASTSFTLDGAPAGNLGVDLAVSSLLGPGGALSTTLPAVSGRVAISGISTAIAQPWVQSSGLNLPAGVGPKMDIVLVAASRGGSAEAGAVPSTDLDLSIRSAGITASLAAVIDGRSIRRRGESELAIRSPGTLASAAAKQSGLELSEGGYLKLVASDFAVTFNDAWKPLLGQTAAAIELTTGGFTLKPVPTESSSQAPPPAPPQPITLNLFALSAKLTPGKAPAISIRGTGSQQQAAFAIQGAMDLPGLIGPSGSITPAAARPVGAFEISNLPTTLASLVLPAPTPASDQRPGLNIARLLQDAVGPTVSVTLNSTQPTGAAADARDISLQVRSQRLNGQAAATIDQKALALRTIDFRGTISPDLAATLIDAMGSGLASRPTLAGPAQLTLLVSPITIPLSGTTPDFGGVGEATLKVGLEGRTTINNVVLAGAEGAPPRDLGPIGLDNIVLTASVPLGSLAAGGPAGPAQAKLTGAVFGAREQRIADIAGDAKLLLAKGGPSGNLDANLRLAVQDSRWIDTFLGRPGFIAGSVGQTASIDAAAVVQLAKPAAKPVPAGAPQTGSPSTPAPAYERIALTASITSPRLVTSQPLKATVTPASASIDAPMVLRWTIDPQWANANLLKPAPGKPRQVRFSAPTELNLAVTRLSLATAPGQGPMAPGVFAADAEVTFPQSTILVGEGEKAAPTQLSKFRARISGGRESGALGFSLTLDDAGGGPGPAGQPAVNFSGGIYNLADAQGNLQTDKAVLSMNGSATSIPTMLVDILANQNGLIAEALGPTATLQIKTQGLSRSSGTVDITATSPRADAQLAGVLGSGVLTLRGTQPLATLKIITPELGSKLVKGLPQFATIEKRAEDGPAVIRITDLSVPIDQDWKKLNGTIVLDLAKARVQTNNVFERLMKLAGQQTGASVGRRLEPITLVARSGVVTYDRVNIPLGEFTLGTSGTVDLVNQRLDVLTFIPFGALTDEAAGLFNTDLGKILGGALPTIEKATMVPFRTSGSFSSPQTKPDMELFVREFGRTLLRPDQLLGGTIEDLLKKLGGNKDKKP